MRETYPMTVRKRITLRVTAGKIKKSYTIAYNTAGSK